MTVDWVTVSLRDHCLKEKLFFVNRLNEILIRFVKDHKLINWQIYRVPFGIYGIYLGFMG